MEGYFPRMRRTCLEALAMTASLALAACAAGSVATELSEPGVGASADAGDTTQSGSDPEGITVNSSTIFTSSATATPSTVAVGSASNISATVTETGSAGLTNAYVELQIFNQTGAAVATTYWSGQNFSAGKSQPYAYSWTPNGSIPAGVYNVAIGVFNSGWTYDYYWNGSAVTITVTQ